MNGSRGSSWPWARLQAGQGAPAPPQSQYPQPALHSVRAAPGGLIVCGRECFLRDGLAQSAYAYHLMQPKMVSTPIILSLPSVEWSVASGGPGRTLLAPPSGPGPFAAPVRQGKKACVK